MQRPAQENGSAWRPSKAVSERVSSLSPKRPRAQFKMPRGVRPALTLVLLVCGVYVFRRLWLTPEAGDLHSALAIVAGALVLLIVAAIANVLMRRRRNRSDDKSTLRL